MFLVIFPTAGMHDDGKPERFGGGIPEDQLDISFTRQGYDVIASTAGQLLTVVPLFDSRAHLLLILLLVLDFHSVEHTSLLIILSWRSSLATCSFCQEFLFSITHELTKICGLHRNVGRIRLTWCNDASSKISILSTEGPS